MLRGNVEQSDEEEAHRVRDEVEHLRKVKANLVQAVVELEDLCPVLLNPLAPPDIRSVWISNARFSAKPTEVLVGEEVLPAPARCRNPKTPATKTKHEVDEQVKDRPRVRISGV